MKRVILFAKIAHHLCTVICCGYAVSWPYVKKKTRNVVLIKVLV